MLDLWVLHLRTFSQCVQVLLEARPGVLNDVERAADVDLTGEGFMWVCAKIRGSSFWPIWKQTNMLHLALSWFHCERKATVPNTVVTSDARSAESHCSRTDIRMPT